MISLYNILTYIITSPYTLYKGVKNYLFNKPVRQTPLREIIETRHPSISREVDNSNTVSQGTSNDITVNTTHGISEESLNNAPHNQDITPLQRLPSKEDKGSQGVSSEYLKLIGFLEHSNIKIDLTNPSLDYCIYKKKVLASILNVISTSGFTDVQEIIDYKKIIAQNLVILDIKIIEFEEIQVQLTQRIETLLEENERLKKDNTSLDQYVQDICTQRLELESNNKKILNESVKYQVQYEDAIKIIGENKKVIQQLEAEIDRLKIDNIKELDLKQSDYNNKVNQYLSKEEAYLTEKTLNQKKVRELQIEFKEMNEKIQQRNQEYERIISDYNIRCIKLNEDLKASNYLLESKQNQNNSISNAKIHALHNKKITEIMNTSNQLIQKMAENNLKRNKIILEYDTLWETHHTEVDQIHNKYKETANKINEYLILYDKSRKEKNQLQDKMERTELYIKQLTHLSQSSLANHITNNQSIMSKKAEIEQFKLKLNTIKNNKAQYLNTIFCEIKLQNDLIDEYKKVNLSFYHQLELLKTQYKDLTCETIAPLEDRINVPEPSTSLTDFQTPRYINTNGLTSAISKNQLLSFTLRNLSTQLSNTETTPSNLESQSVPQLSSRRLKPVDTTQREPKVPTPPNNTTSNSNISEMID